MVDYVEMLIVELRYGVIDNMLSEARANMYMYPEELRFNPYHDPSNGRFTSGGGSGSGVDKSGGSGIINTGAISGALNPYSKEAEKHAVQYYEAIRHMKTDTKKISAATGIGQDKIDKIKNHVFITEHDLLTGKKRFDPSYEIAQSWQRLISGSFKEQDIVLLKHEYAELRYMEKGYSQNEAHIRASKKYNYAKYCD